MSSTVITQRAIEDQLKFKRRLDGCDSTRTTWAVGVLKNYFEGI